MTDSLAHEVSELLRLEREMRENDRGPTGGQRVRIWERKRDLYFRVAQECRAGGDLAGFTEANKAAGHAVTMVHRIAQIGVCSACGSVELVDGEETADNRDRWHCRNCDRRWTTQRGLKPTDVSGPPGTATGLPSPYSD